MIKRHNTPVMSQEDWRCYWIQHWAYHMAFVDEMKARFKQINGWNR